MGYTTDFSGQFNVTPPMKPQIVTFLNRLCETRRMGREQTDKFGVQGEFFVSENVENEPKIRDINTPSSTQPGLWCQWDAIDENTLEWDGEEKFYNYVEWLVYIIEKVLKPNGHTVNGEVTWSGEEADDVGKIFVINNVVSTIEAFSSEVVVHKAGENVRVDVPFKIVEQKERTEPKFLNAGKGIEQGKCPNCGSGDLNYGVLEPIDESIYYPFTCESCGADGEEWYSMDFIGHNLK